ncbi:MAG: hypothetical protein AAFR21_16480 [Pseudomonadota bacterium]
MSIDDQILDRLDAIEERLKMLHEDVRRTAEDVARIKLRVVPEKDTSLHHDDCDE